MSESKPWSSSKRAAAGKKRRGFKGKNMANLDAERKEFNAYEFLCRQQESKEWIEECIGEKVQCASIIEFMDKIRNGVYLCKLANAFSPGAVARIHQNLALEFRYTENINNFLQACINVGLPRIYLFSIPDLWEKKNIVNVIHCIHSLSHYLEHKGITPKMKNLTGKVTFGKEELEKAAQQLKEIEEQQRLKEFDATVFNQPEQEPIEADPEETTLEGDGANVAVAGETAHFLIQTRDSSQKPLDEGGYPIRATLTHKKSGVRVQAKIVDNDDGTYDASYLIRNAGEYSLEVLIDDVPIRSDPFIIVAKASHKTTPARCTVEGTGARTGVAGTEADFVLQARDEYGNERSEGGDNVEVQLVHTTSGIKVDAEVVDLNNGQYSISYTPPESGTYNLVVRCNDVQIENLPSVIIKDAGVSDPKKCAVSGPNLSRAVAGKQSTVQLQAKDKLGNNRESGGEAFAGTLTHKEKGFSMDVDVRDLNNGKYILSFSPTDAAKYDLEVTLRDDVVASYEIEVEDSGKASAEESVATGEGLTTASAGEVSTFSVQAKDRFGNIRPTGGEPVRAFLVHSTSGEKVDCEISDKQNGRYDGSYTLTKAGEWKLHIQMHADNEAATSTSPSQQKSETSASPGENDDELLTGGDDLAKKEEALLASLTEDEAPAETPAHEAKEPAASSSSSSSAEVEWEDLSKSPFTIIVKDAGEAIPENCTVEGEGIQAAVSGEEAVFIINAKDKFGNLRFAGGEKFQVSMFHKKTGNKLATMVKDLGNGKYAVSYTPKDWGEYHLDVKLRNQRVAGPLIIKVAEPTHIQDLTKDELANLTDFDLMRTLKAEAEDDDEDNLILEIQALKVDVVTQIRANNGLEANLRKLDRKIELLIKNRLTIQEVMHQQKGISKFMGRFNRKREGKGQNFGGGTVISDKKKLECYSNLFYLLQTEPHYLAKCVFFIPEQQIDSFLETVILTLYGYAFSPREEYLILSLFKSAIEYEIGAGKTVGDFLETNPIITKMVITYGRRLQGKTFLKEVLFPIIKPIIEDSSLDLEINPVKVMKDLNSAEEIRTGVKSTIKPSEITEQIALANPKVKATIDERIRKLTTVCTAVVQGINSAMDLIPYGLRWVCKTLAEMLRQKYPDTNKEAILNVVGYLIYYRFMNPAIIQPDAFQLTNSQIGQTTRRNLILVAKVMQNLSNNTLFGNTSLETYMECMNPFIKENLKTIQGFFDQVCNVPEPEENLKVHKYVELTQRSAPMISISVNELFSTHKAVLDVIERLAPSQNDPLRVILESLGVPQDPVSEDQNEELSLALVNRFGKDVEKSEMSIAQVYEETKELIRRSLRGIPVENFFPSLPDTLEKARKWAQTQVKEIQDSHATAEAKAAHDESDEEEDWAEESDEEGEHTKKSKQEAELDNLLQRVQKIYKNFEVLEGAGLINKQKDEYASILKDIARDARNRAEVRQRQRMEIDRLKESLKQLQEHAAYLKEQNENYNAYLQDARTKSLNVKDKKGKKKSAGEKIGPFKFSYEKLQKAGVIISLDVPKSQRAKVKFAISSNTPGVFDVAAQVAGVTLKTVTLELDDLLEKQYNGVEKIDFEYVTLDVNMSIHMLNKLVSKKD